MEFHENMRTNDCVLYDPHPVLIKQNYINYLDFQYSLVQINYIGVYIYILLSQDTGGGLMVGMAYLLYLYICIFKYE